MRNLSNLAGLQLSNQELLDENEYLRNKLAAMEDDAKLKQELLQTLSDAISIGYWEWNETTKRPAYFSKEMAIIMGISLDSLYEKYQREDDIQVIDIVFQVIGVNKREKIFLTLIFFI